jgi:broad specificity phosphatase PhoE
MHKLLYRVVLAALLIAAHPSLTSAATIVFVRHAEREGGMSPDVPLSPPGEQRAQQLAEMLKDAGVQRIFVTEVRRTQQTAEPLAAQLHMKPTVASSKDVDGLVSQLRGLGESETVLVVGHANTLPQIIEKLAGSAVPAFPDSEFDRMTVVFTASGGKARVLTLRYGRPAH